MEEEIDLRPYVLAVSRRWFWVILAFVAPVLTVAALFSARSPEYEATAIVAYVAPADVVQFDPRFSEGEVGRPLGAIPELATSDEVWQRLVAQMDWPDDATHEELRSALTADFGSDNSLVRFVVSHEDPAEAAEIANQWAAVFVIWANGIYGHQGGERLQFFENQLADAETALTTATAAWVEFTGSNEAVIISDTLSFYQQTRRSYLVKQQELAGLSDSVTSFYRQIDALPGDEGVSFADQLTFYQLQSRVMNDGESSPIILQTETGNDLISASREQYLLLADGLLNTLLLRREQIVSELDALAPKILDLQQQQQALAAEAFQLKKEVDVARDTVVSLSYKVEEERITAQDSSSGFRLASRAGVPQQPIIRRGIRMSVLAGILGGSMLLGFIVLSTWWRQFAATLPDAGDGPQAAISGDD